MVRGLFATDTRHFQVKKLFSKQLIHLTEKAQVIFVNSAQKNGHKM